MALAKDKILHVVAGAVIALAVTLITTGPGVGFLVGVLAGFAKEGYDLWANYRASKKHLIEPHSVEFEDIIATAGGSALGALIGVALLQVL